MYKYLKIYLKIYRIFFNILINLISIIIYINFVRNPNNSFVFAIAENICFTMLCIENVWEMLWKDN